jgi:hypothetical protein
MYALKFSKAKSMAQLHVQDAGHLQPELLLHQHLLCRHMEQGVWSQLLSPVPAHAGANRFEILMPAFEH